MQAGSHPLQPTGIVGEGPLLAGKPFIHPKIKSFIRVPKQLVRAPRGLRQSARPPGRCSAPQLRGWVGGASPAAAKGEGTRPRSHGQEAGDLLGMRGFGVTRGH